MKPKTLRMLSQIASPSAWRVWYGGYLGKRFDTRYGVDTQAHVGVDALGIDRALASTAVHYEASAIPKFRRAIGKIDRPLGDYVFVDIGSGKGRAVMMAAKLGFRKVVGVELSEKLHRAAERNLGIFRQVEAIDAPVELVNCNALDFEWPDENLVVYVYNPFTGASFEALLDSISALACRSSNDILFVYIQPLYQAQLERDRRFRLVYSDLQLSLWRVARTSSASING